MTISLISLPFSSPWNWFGKWGTNVKFSPAALFHVHFLQRKISESSIRGGLGWRILKWYIFKGLRLVNKTHVIVFIQAGMQGSQFACMIAQKLHWQKFLFFLKTQRISGKWTVTVTYVFSLPVPSTGIWPMPQWNW